MNDLIKIEQANINGSAVNAANSRDIYDYLEVATSYSHWIKRAIDKYDFVKNEDYIAIITDAKSGKRDYIVTIDMAKELCMVSDTEKGKEVRKYFIEVEKRSHKVLTIGEQIALLAQGHQDQEQRIKVLEDTKRLEKWQEKELKHAVDVKVHKLLVQHQMSSKKIVYSRCWKCVKNEFNVSSYTSISAIDFERAKKFIESITIEMFI